MAVNLDRKVQFQRVSEIDGPYGSEFPFSDHGPRISAARQDISDGEKAAAGWIEASVVTRFTVRSSTFTRDLTAADRLSHAGRLWDIQGIKEAKLERRAFLEITARSNV